MDLYGACVRSIFDAVNDNTNLARFKDKVFSVQAPGNIPPPYILVNLNGGGRENVSPNDYADTFWIVGVVSKTQYEARNFYFELEKTLLNKILPMVDGWRMWSKITMSSPRMEVTDLQGDQYWLASGLFRIRCVLEG